MKTIGIVSLCLIAAAVVMSQRPKTFVRDLPADVLRDSPCACFASTACRIFNVSQSWPLIPFCGRATCTQGEGGNLIERVEDCGPQPDPNSKCRNVNLHNLDKIFPECCPEFECAPGAKLTYPPLTSLKTQVPEGRGGCRGGEVLSTHGRYAGSFSTPHTQPRYNDDKEDFETVGSRSPDHGL
ncbi:uncharacterized protein LOC143040915 [Oratosquilla oratoria]|uniref:uncharacterized protein LOC143040915 n=1 Tax=Oratosquilla oratoria TaxID=337810 RepID=UPI003F75D7AC